MDKGKTHAWYWGRGAGSVNVEEGKWEIGGGREAFHAVYSSRVASASAPEAYFMTFQ